MIRDTKSSRVLLAAALVGVLGVAVVDSRTGGADSPLHPVRTVAASVFAPVQSGIVYVTHPVVSALSGVGHAGDRQAEIAALRSENLRLADALHAERQSTTDARERATLLALAGSRGAGIRPAHVIGVAADRNHAWSVAIDVGSEAGVVPDSAVLDATGLVGRVTAVTARTATVLLLIDPISSVGVRSAKSGQIGLLAGAGDELCRLTMFDPHEFPAVGERLLTLGSVDARPYSAGIPVGQVVSVTERGGAATILVRPFATFGALDTVGVAVPGPPQSSGQANLQAAAAGAER